jgi:hypothetical protein
VVGRGEVGTVVEDVHEMTDELMGAFSPPDTIDKTEGSM